MIEINKPPTLVQILYRKLFHITEFAHNQVYKGSRNKNRYKLTENIFIKWDGGLIVAIYDINKNIGLEVYYDLENTMLVKTDLTNMGPKGFYNDVNYLMEAAIKQVTSPIVLNSYSLCKQNILDEIQITFDTLYQNIEISKSSKNK